MTNFEQMHENRLELYSNGNAITYSLLKNNSLAYEAARQEYHEKMNRFISKSLVDKLHERLHNWKLTPIIIFDEDYNHTVCIIKGRNGDYTTHLMTIALPENGYGYSGRQFKEAWEKQLTEILQMDVTTLYNFLNSTRRIRIDL